MHPSQLVETPNGQRSWTEVTFDCKSETNPSRQRMVSSWYLHEVASECEGWANCLLFRVVGLPCLVSDSLWSEQCLLQPGCKLSQFASQSWTVLSAEPDNSQLRLQSMQRFLKIECDTKTWGQNQEKGQPLYAHVVWQQHKQEHHLELLFGTFVGKIHDSDPLPHFQSFACLRSSAGWWYDHGIHKSRIQTSTNSPIKIMRKSEPGMWTTVMARLLDAM